MIEARIGGDGTTVAQLSANEPGDQVAMIDQYLAEHPNGVMFIEVKRDDSRSWEAWKDDLDHIEFMQIGVSGDRAAAQYLCGGAGCTRRVVRATFNPTPFSEPSNVPYDEVLHWTFPVDTVVRLAEVRQLMIDFVTTGEWAHQELWRRREHLVG
ncbi:MAG TPA: Imm1 family immunity protein [Pseudonocardiaceae bacterium]|jgi:hypothetical protein